MKGQQLNSVYRNRVTREEHEVKRLSPTDYKVKVNGEWVPMKYVALKREYTFVKRARNNEFSPPIRSRLP